jgi:hypothetical protein
MPIGLGEHQVERHHAPAITVHVVLGVPSQWLINEFGAKIRFQGSVSPF